MTTQNRQKSNAKKTHQKNTHKKLVNVNVQLLEICYRPYSLTSLFLLTKTEKPKQTSTKITKNKTIPKNIFFNVQKQAHILWKRTYSSNNEQYKL